MSYNNHAINHVQEDPKMFKNQANGRKNLLGIKMREIRKARGISQRQVADDLAELGLVVTRMLYSVWNPVSASSPISSSLPFLSISISR